MVGFVFSGMFLRGNSIANSRLFRDPATCSRVAGTRATLAQSELDTPAPRREWRERRPREPREPFVPIEGATYFTECGHCTAVFPLDPKELGQGRRVQCCVCDNSWFQRPDRLRILSEFQGFKDYPLEEKDRLIAERSERRDRSRMRREQRRDNSEQKEWQSKPNGRRYDSEGSGEQTRTVFIGNLPFSATEEDLKELIGTKGKVVSVAIVKDRETGHSRGFGFASMESHDDVLSAVESLDGFELDGRVLTLRKGNRK